MLIRTALLAALLLAAPAQAAEVVLTHQSDTGRVDLYAERGACVDKARRAVYVPLKGEPIEGCYLVMTADVLQVIFLDGEAYKVHRRQFKVPETL